MGVVRVSSTYVREARTSSSVMGVLTLTLNLTRTLTLTLARRASSSVMGVSGMIWMPKV